MALKDWAASALCALLAAPPLSAGMATDESVASDGVLGFSSSLGSPAPRFSVRPPPETGPDAVGLDLFIETYRHAFRATRLVDASALLTAASALSGRPLDALVADWNLAFRQTRLVDASSLLTAASALSGRPLDALVADWNLAFKQTRLVDASSLLTAASALSGRPLDALVADWNLAFKQTR
ncbi:MAG: hypothetical protein HY924_01410, partial [Elusimicrobia bacterium]|nr:hypothetical protein [Elusimicrobiota bacterium]